MVNGATLQDQDLHGGWCLQVIEEVTDLGEFETLREEWNALASDAGLSIFQTWEWSWHWWKINKKGKKLWLLVVRDADKLAGIAPLYISTSYCGLPIKVASFIGTEATDYLNLIVRPDAYDIISALIDHMLGSTKWGAIDLHQIPNKHEMVDSVRSRAIAGGFPHEQLVQDFCYDLTLPNSWDEYLAGLSKKFRWNVQYYARRLSRDHDVVCRLSDTGSLKRDMQTFFDLHQKRFISKKKPGAYLNPKFRKFHTDMATALCQNNWLRLYVLEVSGRPVATLYGFQFGSSFYYYLGGFDPDWATMSVSTVLIARAIQDSIANGLNSFNFLRGKEAYKQKWQAQEFLNHRLIISRSDKKSGFAQKILMLENDIAKRAKDIINT